MEEIHRQLVAFYPEYTAQGSLTKLIYTDMGTGSEIIDYDQRQVESVKRALARCYIVDLPTQAQQLRANYCRRNLFHFYLPEARVFVPFKLRERRIRDDACYGYIELSQVARLLPGEEPGLVLQSGTRLPLLSNISTARLAYYLGLEILSDFIKLPDDTDLDLLNALAVLRGVLGGQPPKPKSPSTRKFRVKFLPTN